MMFQAFKILIKNAVYFHEYNLIIYEGVFSLLFLYYYYLYFTFILEMMMVENTCFSAYVVIINSSRFDPFMIFISL